MPPRTFPSFLVGRSGRKFCRKATATRIGRRAFLENPGCDGVYIGGGTWLSEPVAGQLEQEFGKPVICNQAAMIRDILHILGDWKPIQGHSRVLSTP